MAKFPLIGPSYTSQSVNADCQSTINLYPEVIESGAGNSQIVLYPAPGLKSFVDLSPPAPPAVMPPDIINTISVLRDGINAGNTFTFTGFVNGPEIKIDDTLIIVFYMRLLPINTSTITAVNLTFGGNNIGSFLQIGPTLDYSSGSTRQALEIFHCKSVLDVPFNGVIRGTITFSVAANDSDYGINLSQIRHLTTLDQVSSQASSGTSFSAPALSFASREFAFSYIWPNFGNGMAVTIPLPFFKFTNEINGVGAANLGPDGNYVSPAGIYSPVWTSIAGSGDAGVINASFKLEAAPV